MNKISEIDLEKSLLQKVIEGDKKSFRELYERNYSDHYRFVYSRCGNTQNTEDIVSETWVIVIENINKFNFSSKFKTFLFGISLNLLKRLYFKKQLLELDEEIFTNAIEKVEVDEKFDIYITKVMKVIPELKESYKNVIEYRFLEGKSLKETSLLMNKSVQNIKVIQNRAIKKIKELIK